jgi:putative ABC transport system permease protein
MNTLLYPTLRKYTAREMQRRPGRTLLTLLGIVLGVAAVFSISVSTATTQRAYRDMFTAVAGRAALEVVAEGWGGFEPGLGQRLERVRDVRAVVPVLQMPTVLLGKSGGAGALVLGVDPAADAQMRDYVVHDGRLLEGDEEGLLLEVGFARAQGCELGKSARLLTPTMAQTGLASLLGPKIAALPVVGLLEMSGAATFNGGAVIFMPLRTAQRLFAMEGRVNSLQLVLAETADVRQVEADVRGLLPAGFVVQSPTARGDLAQDSLLTTELSLRALSLISLVAGAFVILNSFHMNLGERRRQLALLRALGATRRQVTFLLLREGAFLGLTGTVFGIGVGWVLSSSLRTILEQVLGVALPAKGFTLTPFVLALILGPGLAVAATFVPARRAGRRTPLQDLLQKYTTSDDGQRRWPGYIGVALVAVLASFVSALILGWVPPALSQRLLAPVTALGLVGCVLALPLILGQLTRLAARLLLPLLGLEGRLAFRQLNRHPSRTALTVGVLFTGVVTSIGFGQSLRNSIRSIYEWYEHNIPFDYMVRGVVPDSTLVVTTAPLPEELGDSLATLDGVACVDKANFIIARVQGYQVVAIPTTLPPDRPLRFALASGDPVQVRAGLSQGEVVLGTVLAHRLGREVGDWITLETRQGPQQLRIAGTTAEYTVGGMVLYMEWNQGKRLFAMQGVHVFPIMVRKDSQAATGAALKAFCDGRGLYLQSNADFRALLAHAIEGVADMFWGLVVLVFVVASLGVVNTLTMNVLEQTRELGILRAVAMTRGQVRKLILAQALALAVISLVPGVVVGIALAYLMNLGTQPLIGQPVAFHLDGWFVATCFGAALVIAVLAALLPARRAARLQVVQALQYE